jgi:hypothetical protein
MTKRTPKGKKEPLRKPLLDQMYEDSIILEQAVGNDEDGYQLTPEELAELLEDDLQGLSDEDLEQLGADEGDEELFDDEFEEDEDEDPLLTWDEDEEEFA